MAVKRRQRSQKPCDRASIEAAYGSLRSSKCGDSIEASKWLDAEIPSGSESRANANEGYPGTWEISLIPCLRRLDEGYQRMKPLACGQKRHDARVEQGVRTQAVNGIAERRKRSEAKRSTRSRSALTVLMKRGNQTQQEPRGGKGGIGS